MMAAADIFAMPSHVEAWGLVYLEAMRAGVPVIATARGGLAESFEDGEQVLGRRGAAALLPDPPRPRRAGP